MRKDVKKAVYITLGSLLTGVGVVVVVVVGAAVVVVVVVVGA